MREDLPVHTRETTFEEAMNEGVLAFFGDKYGEDVRVVEVNTVVPRFSAELCGGTHCERTGEIGVIVITGESSIGSGMRRIEALSGAARRTHVRSKGARVEDVARKLGAPRDALLPKLDAILAEHDAHAKRSRTGAIAGVRARKDLLANATQVDGVKVLATRSRRAER